VGVIRLAEVDREARVNELEARLAHQDHSLEKMSDEIYWLQKQISQLKAKVSALVEGLEQVAPSPSSNKQPDEVPPHY
jgi:uncharacterized coiled-coil protein SlyX